ncbi:MAG: GntR family transcriptional regulator [Acetobacterales bacterium]
MHDQVRQDLLKRIGSGEFSAGDMLPSEDALCKQYAVSRITIRRAVTDLVNHFIVMRKRGIGTIITRRANNRRQFRLTGYYHEDPRIESTQLLDKSVPASAEVAAALCAEPGTPVHYIRAINHKEGLPYAYVEAYTAEPVTESTEGETVYSGAEIDRLGWRISRAEQELDAIKVSATMARLFGLRAGQPIMRARRVFFSADDEPVRYSITRYHPERYRFTMDLRPGSDLGAV